MYVEAHRRERGQCTHEEALQVPHILSSGKRVGNELPISHSVCIQFHQKNRFWGVLGVYLAHFAYKGLF